MGIFFTLADRINKIAKEIRSLDKKAGRGTYLVVDAIRSPLEAIYFQKRYSSFYLMAVACPDGQRKERLRRLKYSEEQIRQIGKQEGEGKAVKDERFFAVQDIPSCLERADIYLSNSDAASEVEKFSSLTNSIIKFVCLMKRPGIIQPTAMERCMQIAYVAKMNSGCISRQVGAVVTDANFSVKAIGWNDVPSGQVPCSLRNRFDLELGRDVEAFSFYEKNDNEFNGHIKLVNKNFVSIKSTGRNVSFCFKAEYNSLKKEKNQVHTRALHAEENAFLQLVKNGGMGVAGGYLFTTASPCELCSKKAYQLGIKKIFYVDPYPGISVDHILNSGANRPEMMIFNGAVGKAYHKIYSQITPHKDELEALKAP